MILNEDKISHNDTLGDLPKESIDDFEELEKALSLKDNSKQLVSMGVNYKILNTFSITLDTFTSKTHSRQNSAKIVTFTF